MFALHFLNMYRVAKFDLKVGSQTNIVYRISVPYAQKDPRFLFEKRRGQPQEILVSHLNNRW